MTVSFDTILDTKLGDNVEARIREGFPYHAIEALQQFLAVTQTELAEALGVRRQTLSRNLNEKKQHLSPQISDQLYRIARITRRATEVFDDVDSASQWLKTPNAALGHVTPLSLLDTDAGTERVNNVLGRIEHGVFS